MITAPLNLAIGSNSNTATISFVILKQEENEFVKITDKSVEDAIPALSSFRFFRPFFFLAASMPWLLSSLGLQVCSGKWVSLEVLKVPALWWYRTWNAVWFFMAIVVGFVLTAVQTWTESNGTKHYWLAALVGCGWHHPRILFWTPALAGCGWSHRRKRCSWSLPLTRLVSVSWNRRRKNCFVPLCCEHTSPTLLVTRRLKACSPFHQFRYGTQCYGGLPCYYPWCGGCSYHPVLHGPSFWLWKSTTTGLVGMASEPAFGWIVCVVSSCWPLLKWGKSRVDGVCRCDSVGSLCPLEALDNVAVWAWCGHAACVICVFLWACC